MYVQIVAKIVVSPDAQYLCRAMPGRGSVPKALSGDEVSNLDWERNPPQSTSIYRTQIQLYSMELEELNGIQRSVRVYTNVRVSTLLVVLTLTTLTTLTSSTTIS